MSAVHNRDIQSYIDLWEKVPASDACGHSVHPAPSIPRKNPRRDLPRREGNRQGRKDEKLLMMGVPEEQFSAPPALRPIKTGVDNRPTEPVDLSRLSPISLGPGDYAASFQSISRGGFEMEPAKLSETSPTETLPFTPDELWNFHRPQPPPVPRRRSTMRPSSAHQVLGRELPPQGESEHTSALVEKVPTSDTMVTSRDFDYDCYEPYRCASPISASPPSTPTSPSGSSLFPSNSISSRRSKSSSISSLSLDGKPVSSKAAKMLGIDPSATVIANHPASNATSSYIADAPDRYNRHRTLTLSGPQLAAAAAVQAWFQQEAAAPAPRPPPPQSPYDATTDATRIRKCLKKTKKPDTELLSATLVTVSQDPHRKLEACRQKYRELYGADMVAAVREQTSGHYRLLLTRLMAGPHASEAQALKQTEASYFMDDKLVAEALFGKEPEEIKHIKHNFELAHGITLRKALEDLYLTNTQTSGSVFDAAGPSAEFGRACIRTLFADREVETVENLAMLDGDSLMRREQSLNSDVEELYKTPHGRDRRGTNKYLGLDMLLEMVMRRSHLYLAEICRIFQERHGKQLPELVLAKDRSRMIPGSYYPVALVCPAHCAHSECLANTVGDQGYAVAFVLKGAMNKPQRDAKLLEACMKGIGTNDTRLIARMIRVHYDSDPRHMLFVKEVYQQRYGRTLAERVKKDTKGAYRHLLLKIVEGRTDLEAETLF
jgi:hypothetical protein